MPPSPPPTFRELPINSASLSAEPKSNIPSHLTDQPLPPMISTDALEKKERDDLLAQVHNLNQDRRDVNFEEPNRSFPDVSAHENMGGSNGVERHHMIHSEVGVEEYSECSPTRTLLATESQHPTIDIDGLSWPSRGTLHRKEATEKEKEERLAKLSGAVRTILECVGEDPDREGLLDTPKRYAKAILFFTKGYEENLRTIVNSAVFQEYHDEMVIVKDIEFFSLCEHHLVPFHGRMHMGYIPNHRIIGLSKIARIVEMFSRRLQVQERLTKQVAHSLSEILQPQGVALVVESSHLCMVMRGVEKTQATTITSCMLGRLRSTATTREEFFNLISRK